MKQTVAATAALLIGLSGTLLAGTAASQEFPEHGHLLLTGLEYDAKGEPIGYKKCRGANRFVTIMPSSANHR